ncbi:hypothetical protein DB35_00555 [Streptomyces abyssalis]|nr:hypothetical protein DB35_00555 [Streptomyces abyssalis]
MRDGRTWHGALAHGVGQRIGALRVAAPGLGGVVREVVVRVDARAVGGEPACDGVADAGTAAGSGDEGGAAGQRQRVAAGC